MASIIPYNIFATFVVISYTKEEFEDKWVKRNKNKTSGIVLILEPQADFRQRQKHEKAERGRYLENIVGYFTPYKKSFLYLGLVMLLITAMQAVLPILAAHTLFTSQILLIILDIDTF